MGYNSYEVRGSEVYAVISDDFEYTSMPVFEIEGDRVYPTVFNDRDDYGMPAFEISDGWARACGSHAEDDFDFEVPRPDRQDEDAEQSEKQASGSSSEDPLWTLAGWAVGLGAAAFMARRQARLEARAHRDGLVTPTPMPAPAAPTWPSAPATPAGWYWTSGGSRFWDGMAWTGHNHPAPAPHGYGPQHGAPGEYVIPTPARGTRATVVAAWFLTVLTVGYMLPWAVAVTRRTSNSTCVGLVCLLLGWTVIGWIVALAMACTGSSVATGVRRPFAPGR